VEGVAASLLDGMYGEGTLQRFSPRMDLSETLGTEVETFIPEQPEEFGSIAVEVAWKVEDDPVGIYRLLFDHGWVHTSGLWIETAWTGMGILTHLIRELNEWWGSIGITLNTMSPTPGIATEILESCGFGELPSGDWGALIPSPALSAFLEWVAEGEPQPVGKGKKPRVSPNRAGSPF
jgi:GNAT superfamily N-acetyltransferase